MGIPTYGAAPLAKTFVLLRALSVLSMIAIVGMTANFVSEIVSSNITPPQEVVATLAITCLATLYSLISIPFFCAQAHFGLFVMTAIDTAILIAFIVVSVVIGRPVSYLNCMNIANASAAASADSAAAFVQALASNLDLNGSALSLTAWAASDRDYCYETKAIWGLCIALCILFACSATILPTLWFKARKAGVGAKFVV